MAWNDDSQPPELLRPFVPFVERWGAVKSDTQRYEYADRAEADPDVLRDFENFCRQWTPEVSKAFNAWEKMHPMTESELAAKFYFTLLLADELEFSPPSAKGTDAVLELIGQLAGDSERTRAWAARSLADYAEDGLSSVPALRDALRDDALTVQVWAHYSLALLEGDMAGHRESIERVASLSDGRDKAEAKTALEWLGQSQEWRDIQSLVRFCILNDAGQIVRLSARVDVNMPGKDGVRPLSFAVGNSNSEATRALLEHGADPNLRDAGDSETVLHNAAAKRRGVELVPVLLAHGAEVNAADHDGRTPLDWALEHGRREAARLLQGAGGRRGSRWRRVWRR